MVGELSRTYNWTRPTFERSRPYFRKFIDDVNSGAITRDELEAKAAPSNIPEDRYEQIKPHLINAASRYVESIGNIEQLVGQTGP